MQHSDRLAIILRRIALLAKEILVAALLLLSMSAH